MDKTGELLPMDGSKEYQLCGVVDEVEGRKVEFPNRMNFFLGGRCIPSKVFSFVYSLSFLEL